MNNVHSHCETTREQWWSHKIKINFKNGHVKLYTRSKDWTKDFTLEVNYKNIKIMFCNKVLILYFCHYK